jgi:carbon starvation protein CstA
MLFINALPMNRCSKPLMMTKSNNHFDIVTKETKALQVGISLDILSKIATDIRYGRNIVDWQLIILELLLGYHTYGTDRYNDEGLPDNRIYIYDIVFIIIISIISIKQNLATILPFDLLLYSTRFYKQFKQHLGVFKSIYVAMMWTTSIIILPSVLHDHNYNILHEPLDYTPYIFLMIATSNIMDTKDIEDDKKNNIETIPVKYGQDISNKISKACMLAFFALLCLNLCQKYPIFLSSF